LNIQIKIVAKTGGSSNRLASFGEAAQRVGITKTLLVSEGDVLSASVYAKYVDITDHNETVNATPLANALLGMLSGGILGGENPISSTSVEDGLTGLAASGTSDSNEPQAYFNYILLDKSYNYVDAGFKQLTTAAADDGTGSGTHELLEFESITIPQDGYIMIFVSNESEELTEVYFDDLMINHHKTELIQADDYYPFGLTFNSYTKNYSQAQKYKYNGKELEEETDLYDYGARFYDVAVGRFSTIDPLSDFENQESWTGYHYTLNNPISKTDPTGMLSTDVVENEDGTYTVVGGDAEDGDKSIYVVSQDESGNYERTGDVIGESVTTHSFFGENGQAVKGAVIDPNSTEGQDFIDQEIIAGDPNLVEYALNAGNGDDFDLKDRKIKEAVAEGKTPDQHRYRGSVTSDGKFGSARDFGNIGAGIVASRNKLNWRGTRLAFDAYQSYKSGELKTEGMPTQKAQKVGFKIGVGLRKNEIGKISFNRFGE
jgi:RHS repeat-associated protein